MDTKLKTRLIEYLRDKKNVIYVNEEDVSAMMKMEEFIQQCSLSPSSRIDGEIGRIFGMPVVIQKKDKLLEMVEDSINLHDGKI